MLSRQHQDDFFFKEPTDGPWLHTRIKYKLICHDVEKKDATWARQLRQWIDQAFDEGYLTWFDTHLFTNFLVSCHRQEIKHLFENSRESWTKHMTFLHDRHVGSPFFLVGPVELWKYTITCLSSRPQILILGDLHGRKRTISNTPSTVSITQWLMYMIRHQSNTSFPLDFYLEYPFPGKSSLTHHHYTDKDFLFYEIPDTFYDCFSVQKKKCPVNDSSKIRFHFTDVRRHALFQPYMTIFRLLQFLTTTRDSFQKYRTDALFQRRWDHAVSILEKTPPISFDCIPKIEKYTEHLPVEIRQVFRDFFEKELKHVTRDFPFHDTKAFVCVMKQYQRTQTKLDDRTIGKFALQGYQFSAVIMDMYVIGRMFQPFTPPQSCIIVYTGRAHSKRYCRFFDKLHSTLDCHVVEKNGCLNLSDYPSFLFTPNIYLKK